MKRISKGWYIFLAFWFLSGITFIILNGNYRFLTIDDSNLILGLISVGVSIVSLGLATMKLPKFKGSVNCWNVEANKKDIKNKSSGIDIGIYNCISFEIDNYQKTAIQNMIVNFRIPKSIIYNYNNNNFGLKFRESKDTVIVTFDSLRFLGNSTGDCKLNVDHFLNVSKWKEKESHRVIYVTVAGDNIEPTTLKIKSEKVDALLVSTQQHDKKVKLSK